MAPKTSKTAKTQPATTPNRVYLFIREPSVLICHEKHGDVYFVVNNEDDLHRVALMILRERHAKGYWYYPPGEKPAAMDFGADDIKAMPASLHADAKRKLGEYQQALRGWQYDTQILADIEKALAEKDGRLAWEVLRAREGAEYERISYHRLSTEYRG